MGLDSMRGTHGRCPPLLVGGLLVVAFIMTCNWWSSSTQNMELLKQLDELAEQLRRCNNDKDQSMQLRLSVEGRLKSTEEELAQLRVRLEQQDINADDTRKSLQDKDAEIGTLKTAAEAAKNAAKLCTTELESLKKVSQSQEEVIKSLKIEKDELAKQKEERRKDAEKLKTDLEKVTSELNNLKASQPAPGTPNVAALVRTRGYDSRVSNVQIVDRGLIGIKFHGLPVLPHDPPGVARPQPRFSVTKIRAGQGNQTLGKGSTYILGLINLLEFFLTKCGFL
ncbi:uncharacterized protein LOC135945212 isoform X2 [Cloeon dipterum]|uniref:uncharacterized protein LOC135945212 isoform X2 n=1 Tax=Cloeon dipterum TaxID=197152 RepID=UPI00321F9DC6